MGNIRYSSAPPCSSDSTTSRCHDCTGCIPDTGCCCADGAAYT
jgi:hypothetical protein